MTTVDLPVSRHLVTATFAGGLLAFFAVALATPAAAVSLQWHTQVSDSDFLIAGGNFDGIPTSMATGLYDRDNRSDLVVCSVENNSCWLYYGTGNVGGARVFGAANIVFVGPFGGFGSSASFIGDINGDGYEDLAVGAPNGTGVGGVTQGGSLWIFFGRGDGFSGQVGYYDANTTVFGTATGDGLGFSASAAGDLNGDGYGDFWVSAPNRSQSGVAVGAVYLFAGRPSWPTEVNDSSAALKLIGASADGAFGRVLFGNIDLNNDSKKDLLTSSTRYRDLSGTPVGAAFAFAGPFPLDGRTVDATRANVTYWGNTLVPTLGAALGFAANFMAEGGRTVFVGAPVYANNTSTGGSVYLFAVTSLLCCQQLNTWDAVGLVYTREANDSAGASLSAGGDINHDGYPDLLVGAPYADVGPRKDAGRVYIVYGKDVTRQPLLLDSASEAIEGKTNRTYLGASVRLADFTGDGWSDLLLGSPGENYSGSGGAAYGFVGRPRNRAPEVAISVNGSLIEGTEIRFEALVYDADNDRLTWSWAGLLGMSDTDNAHYTYQVYNDEGFWSVTLTVFDGTLYNWSTVRLTIANAPPNCTFKAASRFVEGQAGQVLLQVTDPGSADLWNATWEGPANMSRNGNAAVYRPGTGADFLINVTVVDNDGGVGTCQFVGDVQNVAPAITIIGPTLLYEGESALFTAIVEDPGANSGDLFYYNWTGPSSVATDLAFLFAASRPGHYAIQVIVVDLDGDAGVANATIDVLNVPPDVQLLVPPTVSEGDQVNLTIKQYSGFAFDEIRVSWLVCASGYTDGLVYRIPMAVPGDFCIRVLVFDDDGESVSFEQTLSVTNRPPVKGVDVDPKPPYREGDVITFAPVIGAWETTPPQAILFQWYLDGDQISGEPRLTTVVPVGTHKIGLRAVDQDGLAQFFNFSITVENSDPLVRIEGPTSLTPNTLGAWHADASDASGKPVRLTWDVDGVQITTGPELSWKTSSMGSHVIRVSADDGAGGVTVAQTVVSVSPPPAIGAGIDLRWIAVPLGAAAAFAAGILLGAYVVGRIRERRRHD